MKLNKFVKLLILSITLFFKISLMQNKIFGVSVILPPTSNSVILPPTSNYEEEINTSKNIMNDYSYYEGASENIHNRSLDSEINKYLNKVVNLNLFILDEDENEIFSEEINKIVKKLRQEQKFDGKKRQQCLEKLKKMKKEQENKYVRQIGLQLDTDSFSILNLNDILGPNAKNENKKFSIQYRIMLFKKMIRIVMFRWAQMLWQSKEYKLTGSFVYELDKNKRRKVKQILINKQHKEFAAKIIKFIIELMSEKNLSDEEYKSKYGAKLSDLLKQLKKNIDDGVYKKIDKELGNLEGDEDYNSVSNFFAILHDVLSVVNRMSINFLYGKNSINFYHRVFKQHLLLKNVKGKDVVKFPNLMEKLIKEFKQLNTKFLQEFADTDKDEEKLNEAVSMIFDEFSEKCLKHEFKEMTVQDADDIYKRFIKKFTGFYPGFDKFLDLDGLFDTFNRQNKNKNLRIKKNSD